MSDTPRTDFAAQEQNPVVFFPDFARTLERELAAMTAEVERLTQERDATHENYKDEHQRCNLLRAEVEQLRIAYDLLAKLEEKTSQENEKLLALLRRHVERIEIFGTRGTAEVALLADSRAALGEERDE